MKKAAFISLFITAHAVFIVLIIHKQNEFIALSHQKQKMEKGKEELLIKKKQYTQQQYALANHTAVKNFAASVGMKPMAMSQVRKLSMPQSATTIKKEA